MHLESDACICKPAVTQSLRSTLAVDKASALLCVIEYYWFVGCRQLATPLSVTANCPLVSSLGHCLCTLPGIVASVGNGMLFKMNAGSSRLKGDQ